MPHREETFPNDQSVMRRASLGVSIAGKKFGSYRGGVCPACGYHAFSNSTYLRIVRSAPPRGITWDTVEQ
jgi:hypothetical protein